MSNSVVPVPQPSGSIRVNINASSSGSNTLVAAVAAKQIVVMQFNYERTDPVTVRFESSGGTVLHGPCGPSARGGGLSSAWCPVGWFQTVAGEGLVMNLSSAVQVGGSLVYALI